MNGNDDTNHDCIINFYCCCYYLLVYFMLCLHKDWKNRSSIIRYYMYIFSFLLFSCFAHIGRYLYKNNYLGTYIKNPTKNVHENFDILITR